MPNAAITVDLHRKQIASENRFVEHAATPRMFVIEIICMNCLRVQIVVSSYVSKV